MFYFLLIWHTGRMQITVFGASGRVGQRVIEVAQENGHSVIALVHAHNPFIESETLRVVEGNIQDESSVRTALKGSQAVISTLGSWGTINKDILSSGMEVIIPAMQASGIRRIISLTGADAQMPNEHPRILQSMSHGIFTMLAPKIMADGERHLRLLQASNLDWTCVRSPVMNNYGKVTYVFRMKWPLPFRTINRQAVAMAMVDQLAANDCIKKAPTIFRG